MQQQCVQTTSQSMMVKSSRKGLGSWLFHPSEFDLFAACIFLVSRSWRHSFDDHHNSCVVVCKHHGVSEHDYLANTWKTCNAGYCEKLVCTLWHSIVTQWHHQSCVATCIQKCRAWNLNMTLEHSVWSWPWPSLSFHPVSTAPLWILVSFVLRIQTMDKGYYPFENQG